MNVQLPQLSYLGVISQPGRSDYGFRIINDDKSARLLVLTIDAAVFLTKQLLLQEAPDLCFQKVLADLRSDAPALVEETIGITEMDIVNYRASHVKTKSHFKYQNR
jgi:hypothetical protein